MDRRMPVEGDFYKHFKGGLYQVRAIALDSDSLQQLVVYQAMYAPFQVWVRPLDEFMSVVDREKYPDAVLYRFVHVTPEGMPFEEKADDYIAAKTDDYAAAKLSETKHFGKNIAEIAQAHKEKTEAAYFEQERVQKKSAVSDEEFRSVLFSGKIEEKLGGRMGSDEIGKRGFMEFLDAEKTKDKRIILISLRPYLTKRILENIAVALDLVLEEGDEQRYYDDILYCLQTMEKYEGNHLRG